MLAIQMSTRRVSNDYLKMMVTNYYKTIANPKNSVCQLAHARA